MSHPRRQGTSLSRHRKHRAERIRYIGSGTQVTLSVATKPGFAILEVEDHGPAIPESELADIFRPFHRVDHARSSSTGGFDVGLPHTERAVRLQGGTIQATNRPGGGPRS